MQRSQPSDELGATLAPGAAAGTNLATTVAPHSAAAPSREPAIGLTLPAFSPPNPTPVPPSATERTTLREPEAARISGLDKTQISRPGAAVSVALDETHIGPPHPARIGRFTVLRTLGAGGMGVVYAAYDEELDRRVAIKVVRDDVGAGAQGRERMKREAQAMAKVSHPNVVQVYQVGDLDDGQLYVAMEFVKGTTLADWLGSEERGWEEALEMYLQAGRGLAGAHREGLVHRDFKPDNVLIGTDGRARVLDFGLARAEGVRSPEVDSALLRVSTPTTVLRSNLTLAGTIMGTPAFMSPEQHLGESADARSDQFSFCVAVYGSLYGVSPFAGTTLMELGESVTSGALRPPPEGSPVPTWVWQALKTGLATRADDRHPSMDTLLAALTPDQVHTRRRWLWPAALVGVSSLAVLVTLALVRGSDPSGADLAAIERLQQEARDAATRLQWVYPTPVDPRDTAYNRVVQLEHFEGPAAEPAFTAALGLRSEFAEALIVLGDRYFDDPLSRPYARDYYVQAMVFVPDDPRAAGRSGVTIGQLSDLQQRAADGQFGDAELIAADPLRILADPDRVRASSSALALARDAARGSALGRDRITAVFRKQGLLQPGDELDPPRTQPPLVAALPPEPPPTAQPEALPSDDLPTRLERERRLKVKPAEAKPAAPEPDEPVASDPDGSRALSTQADAARRRGETSEAEKLFNQALDLWNGNAAALIGLSDIAFERGNFDRAVKYAEKAVRQEPAKPDYLLRLGDAYFKVFRYSDAQLRYERAGELGHPKANERLTRIREKLGG
jgi:serine/threonine protein kinase